MADWSELKRLAEAAQSTFGSFDPTEDEFDFMSAITPDVVLALIAENEGMVGRIRFFELVHGGRASEVFHQMSVLHDEVRRLKILAGEDVPPPSEDFVGLLQENGNARLRRKLRNLNDAPKVPASLVFPPVEQQITAGDTGAMENCRCNEKLQELQAERDQLRAEVEALRKDAERYRFVRELAWYVDQAAYVYEVGNSRSLWSSERESVDADDVEEAIDAAMGDGGRADA